jgi:methionyl-tRNA formyltransferase
MRIIFMGSPEFAIPSLRIFYDAGQKIEAVITQPDKKRGRGLTLTSPPVKTEAERMGIPVYQPESIREKGFIDLIGSIRPDVIAVVAYGKILPEGILEIPEYGCINLHGSLLPKYRGAAPIQWAIINGEKRTGVTTILMDKGMDTGDILLQEENDIEYKDTSGTLSKKLSDIGAKLLLSTIKDLKIIKPRPQEHSSATYAPLLKKEDGQIDWSKSAEEIRNQVRGMDPWPGAYTFLEKKILKIWDSDIIDQEGGKPGTVMQTGKHSFLVSTGKESLLIKELQLEGKPRTTSLSFLQGRRISEGIILG